MAGLQYYFFPSDSYYPRPPKITTDDVATTTVVSSGVLEKLNNPRNPFTFRKEIVSSSNMKNPRRVFGSSSSLQVEVGSSSSIPRNPFSFRDEIASSSSSSLVLPIDYQPGKLGQKFIDPLTNDTYLLEEEIGSSCNGLCRVYRAQYTACLETNGCFVPNGHVTLKIINKNLQESDELQNQVHTSISYTRDNTRKLIGLKRSFTTDELVCISLPYMNRGCLRYILSTRPDKKLPEDFIAVVLKEVVVGLSDELHVEFHNPRAHKTLNAGDIFVHIDDATEEMLIKLAFEASVYDSEVIEENQNCNVGEASSSSSFLDVKSIFKWGAAPEVLRGENDTPKSDVWLLGITALELAYGDIRVRNRGDLDYITKKIRKKKRLPRSLEKLLLKRKAKLKKVNLIK
ncbi:serine/threonine-protein kinase BLUS1-like [Lycium ferocissimum]|uniref:serine/threonine-protein kinase BLUS1-like n=1 Tax=Lycium ferocissimum TaxID=112874 RepID=UPI0028158BCE|nr:serine/threonine-protein kinase BLUS1-like [Lycium ferocissimum]